MAIDNLKPETVYSIIKKNIPEDEQSDFFSKLIQLRNNEILTINELSKKEESLNTFFLGKLLTDENF